MAFGKEPGAIPTSGPLDGHMAWADDLRIPPLVSKCVHYTAAHEIRNSFPLDSIREGASFPAGDVDERVYPGVHSNVGGGYRPGEARKSLLPNELVSLIPLNAMFVEALKAGVPLNRPISDDFAIADRMRARWNAYMAHPSLVGRRSTEAWALAHMRLYYAWRFHAIKRNLRAGNRKEGSDIAEQETKFRADAESLERQIEEAERPPASILFH